MNNIYTPIEGDTSFELSFLDVEAHIREAERHVVVNEGLPHKDLMGFLVGWWRDRKVDKSACHANKS